MNRRTIFITLTVLVTLALVVGACATARSVSAKGGINNPPGVPLYVVIEVSWDGESENGDWMVWGPAWDPVVGGTLLTGCTDCLEMSYDFVFRGPTLHFDEIYVPGVAGTPQVRHVTLRDIDGDGVYTGSLSAEHYTWEGSGTVLYMDRLDYEVTVENGTVVDFYYLQYEHKKMTP